MPSINTYQIVKLSKAEVTIACEEYLQKHNIISENQQLEMI